MERKLIVELLLSIYALLAPKQQPDQAGCIGLAKTRWCLIFRDTSCTNFTGSMA